MHRYIVHELRNAAKLRNGAFNRLKRNRPLGKDYEDVGLLGEWAFGYFCGLMPRMAAGPDGGWDFQVPLVFKVDVKTSRKGDLLLVEEGKVKADIYVLAHYKEHEEDFEDRPAWETGKAELVGWTFGTVVAATVPYDTGRGVINHAVPADQLRPMEDLRRMLGKWWK